MDFGNLLSRTWELVWENKFLIALGIIVAFTTGGTGGGSNFGGFGDSGSSYESGDGEYQGGDFENFDFGEGFSEEELEELFPALGIMGGFLAVILCVVVIIAIAFAYISRVATGAIIAGANQIETTGASSFGEAWKVGWANGIRLFLIGVVSSIPALVAVGLGVILIIPLVGVNTQVEDIEALAAANAGLVATIGVLFCVGMLVSLVISAIQIFADRACVLEEKGVFESYMDGWGVLRDNLGPAVLLFLIQVGIQIVIGLVLFLPAIISSCCCILWPVMLAINGTVLAYFTTMWTLAWREWTSGPGEPFMLDQAPAV